MLEITGLETRAGDFRLKGIDLTVPAGAYAVLLGPPGSGKSVLIETICGLRSVTAGGIRLEGEDITEREPRFREVGYVPQDYLLFPTKRVRDNLLYGLRSRGLAREDAERQVKPIVELLHLEPLLDRWPRTLSGGEQQRAALARALATHPRLLLLDEPVSALDEATRDRVCRELRRIQRELGITTVHISHNLEEAFGVADLAVLLRDGRVVQAGTMEDLVHRPRTPFVARFLRAENVFEGNAGDGVVRIGDVVLRTSGRASGSVGVMIRPERIGLSAEAPSAGAEGNVMPVRIERRVDRGAYVRVELAGPLPLIAHVSHHVAAILPGEAGAQVHAFVPPDDVRLLETEGDG